MIRRPGNDFASMQVELENERFLGVGVNFLHAPNASNSWK